jgi:O-acetyl-ADP-ribose deacetylase (regulator of RNase III)
VIHTVGPVYRGGASGEAKLLASCYKRCFEVAAENGLKSLAFPSISTGAYSYPISDASRTALETTLAQLERFPEIDKVLFVLFSDSDLKVYQNTFARI